MESTGVGELLRAGQSVDGAVSERRAENALAAENESLKSGIREKQRTIGELRAAANGIRTGKIKSVTAAGDRPEGRPRGRPRGQKPTINRRPEHIDGEMTVDGTECPGCGGPLSENVTDEYDRVAQIAYVIRKNILCHMKRRWCKKCKKQKSQPIPGVRRYARRSANHSAATVLLNTCGMSHARAAECGTDLMKIGVSRSAAYRDKKSHAADQKPRHDAIRDGVLGEEMLGCDEFHWPVAPGCGDGNGGGKKGNSGYGLIALGRENCLIEIAANRRIDTLKKFLPGYRGLARHDSYSGWLHVGGRHQLCMAHQLRLPKEDLKYGNPGGEVREFLEQLVWMYKRYYDAHRIGDGHTRAVAARCPDARMRDVMNADCEDDKKGTINKYKKRWRREGIYISTFLHIPGLDPDSNDVERMNRKFVSIRSDGGGSRSESGMRASSILFTVFATCRLNGTSFYDVLCSSAGDG